MEVERLIKPGCPSFIGWLGGKTKLRATIINCIPPHTCYVEVFAGSATVFFGKPASLSKIEIVNDINPELANLMKVISGGGFDESVRQEFIGYVRMMPASRSVFKEYQNFTPDQISKLNPAQRAFRYYYLIKKGFSCTPDGGYEASPYSANRYNMKTDFEQFAKRFREGGAQIENLDFVELIEKYNKSRVKTFFFMDPPYFVADGTNYYEFVFDHDKHLSLKDCCDKINKTGNTFLITYDDVSEVVDLYRDYFIYRTDPIVYQAAEEQEGRSIIKTELFVTNYDLHAMFAGGAKDLFDELDLDDERIGFGKHIGLTRIQRGK